MREQASYLSKKFIRNGISAFVLAALIIGTRQDTATFSASTVLFPIIGILWMVLGFTMRKKLKANPKKEDEKVEMFNNYKTFRVVESLFTLALILCIVFSVKKVNYADYFVLPVLLIYAAWLYKQIKQINNYFKSLQL